MKLNKLPALALSLILLSSMGTTGCTPKVGGNDYSTTSAQQAYNVEFGTVVSVRNVQINDDNSRASVGAVGGAVVGGVIGNMFGGGAGRTLATLGGAALGAAAGGAAGNAMGNQVGLEITMTLDNGKNLVVVQGADMAFSQGQRVRVTQGADGKARVSPL